MLVPVPLHYPRRQTGHSLLPPVRSQGSSIYGNMVTTNPENVFQKLIQRDRWDLKDMKKKDEWLLRTGTLLHKAGVAVALKNGRPTIAKIKAVQPKLGLRTMQVMLENLVQVYEEQISVAFDVLVNRLDLSDAWLCSEVTRHMGTRDGQTPQTCCSKFG